MSNPGSNTTFVQGTVITSGWLNAINDFFYDLFEASTTPAEARDALGLTDGTANLVLNNLTVEGDLTVEGALTVEGESTFEGDATFLGDVDMSSATSVTYLDGSITTNDLSEDVLNLILSSTSSSGGGGIASGDGRLSLASGVKVMLTDYTGITSIYYVGGLILTLNEGSGAFSPFSIGEISQALSDTNYSPAASSASKAYDIFGWKSTLTVSSITRSSTTATVTTSASHNITTGAVVFIAGADQEEYNGYQTLTAGSGTTFTFTVAGAPTTPATGTITAATARISRGPEWRNRGQAITGATNATPVVLTCNSHGFSNGDLVTVENVGGNTGANGTYVAASVSANNITLTGSVGNGVYITGTGSVAGRGVGAGTTEIEELGNSYVNTVAITNGPTAQMGTYLGTIVTNGSNQLDWKLGSIAVGGGPAWLGVWNVSNSVTFEVTVTEATASWTMGAGSRTFGPTNGSSSNRISFVRGLNLAGVSASQSICVQPGAGTGAGCTIAADSTTEAMQGQQGALASVTGAVGGIFNTSIVANARGNTFFGFHFLQGMEENSASVPASTQATPVFAGNLNGAHTGLYGVVLNARLTQ